MIYGYIRVSTDKQDCENQKLGIENKAKALGIIIDKYIEDSGVSGIKEPGSRNKKRKLDDKIEIINDMLLKKSRKQGLLSD